MKHQGALPATWFNRPTLDVARGLLNCVLCRKLGDEVIRWNITEVEAYDGPHDKACHAHKGKTQRTDVMFGPAGVWYVYLCYGVHWMLNVVTGPEDYPAAVLIRGAGEILGPGRLTRALCIDGDLNCQPVGEISGLWIEDGERIDDDQILRTARIGVSYAGEDWAGRKYRFIHSSMVKQSPSRE